MHIHNRHTVFISRWGEVANHTFKEYEQSCKEQFYLGELLQITWCIFAKQKFGKATDLSNVTYENVIDYSYDFESFLIEKAVERKIRLCFKKLSKYRKLPVFYLNIYQRDIGVRKGYLEGYFHFHWLEIQQVGEVLEKMKLGNCIFTSKDLENIHEDFITWKKTYPEIANRRNFFLAACSLFFISTTNDINYNVAIKLRPYGDLIGIDNSSLDKYLNDSKILRTHAILHDAAGFVREVFNTVPTYCYV